MKNFYRIFYLIIVCIIFSGCLEIPSESIIFNKNTCQLPCWSGIIPGETTLDEAIILLQNNKDICSSMIQKTLIEPNDSYIFEICQTYRENIGIIRGKAGFVEEITIGYPDQNSFRLYEIIHLIGDPDGYVAMKTEREVHWLETLIVYKNLGVILDSGFTMNEYDKPSFTPDFQIHGISLMPPEFIEEYILRRQMQLSSDELGLGFRNWDGYSEILYIPE